LPLHFWNQANLAQLPQHLDSVVARVQTNFPFRSQLWRRSSPRRERAGFCGKTQPPTVHFCKNALFLRSPASIDERSLRQIKARGCSQAILISVKVRIVEIPDGILHPLGLSMSASCVTFASIPNAPAQALRILKMPERVWKHLFAGRLAELFVSWGIGHVHALEDAYAHADEHYPQRSNLPAEEEAVLVFGKLPRPLRH